jgi:nitroimidazol reductase NimA-like FMN-containing flavoprotein (pyridoxamine 5'-phosphate oxidase superfamily)
MNFIVRDGAYYMTSYGKAQKVMNIRRNPKVGVMVETGGAYAELKGVMVRGDCELIEDPERVAEVLSWLGEGRSTARPAGAVAARPSASPSRSSRAKPLSWDHKKLGGRY